MTITAYANKDFNFIGWYDIDNNKLSDSVSYTFLLKEQIQNYIAKWEVNNKIYTKEELFNISDMKKSYQLMNDINLEGEEWTPLGTSSNPFAGLFVGNGYKIYNFKILSSNSSSVGFFGYISGEIIDLQICDFVIDVSSSTYSSNSWVDNYITAGSIGGILQNAGLIRNCYASGSIKIQSSGSSTRSSGGYYSGGSTVNVGGLIGSNSGKIYNCYSDIVIESSSSASSKTSSSFAYCYSGGIVGKNATSGIVSNCYALGTVKSVAYSSSYSTSSSAYASSRSYSGGIVGQNDGQIKNCFSNVQEITTASASPSGNSQSSIVRVNDDIAAYAPNTNSQILNCYKDNQIIINNTFFNDTLGFKLYLSEINMIFESDNVWSLIEGEFPKLYWQN